MFIEKDIWASRQAIYAETHLFSSRCRCANGHPFTAEIYFSINIKTDKPAFDRLATIGTLIVQCPTCKADCRIAEPVTLHDPEKQQFALFIPETLTHREIPFRAALLTRIAETDANLIPPYFGDFQTLLGLPDLIEWRSASSSPPLKRPSYAYTGRPSPHPTTHPPMTSRKSPPGPVKSNEAIHEAFADLARSDNEAPSYPAPFSLESDSEDSGDWLDDAALSEAERALSNGSQPSSNASGSDAVPDSINPKIKRSSDTNPKITTSKKRNKQEDAALDAKPGDEKQ
ncbi:MAG: hypothetical protein GY762_20480 [Proteobacteria bacterium]|nr:hypothetical protein [Pseudomonadota bacterium]